MVPRKYNPSLYLEMGFLLYKNIHEFQIRNTEEVTVNNCYIPKRNIGGKTLWIIKK